MLTTTLLGLPRIGPDRELKTALERHWAGRLSSEDLLATGAAIRRDQLTAAAEAGIDLLPSGDFSLYDHVLDHALMIGAVPRRFAALAGGTLERYFAMARGSGDARPLQMTKWLDTNYHHLVPELEPGMELELDGSRPLGQLRDAQSWGLATRPVLIGPVSLLLLSRATEAAQDTLTALPRLLDLYSELLGLLAGAGASAVQVDEPCLTGDLGERELRAVEDAWAALAAAAPQLELTLATYFASLGDGLGRVLALPFTELHLDLVRAPEQLGAAVELIGEHRRLSLGLIDGRNVWAADLDAAARLAAPVIERLGSDRVRLAPSCSLLHVPYSASREARLDPGLREMLAFGEEKIAELVRLRELLTGTELRSAADGPSAPRFGHDRAVQERLAAAGGDSLTRSAPYERRAFVQAQRLGLPELPTTTIGSFPQTAEIRTARRRHSSGEISDHDYDDFLRAEIARVIAFQEEVGLDVLVHGEPERGDMVQYFAERLRGFAATEHGWVQSYGSRCVKPPLLYGDVSRPEPITGGWWQYAQSLTERPVKGMLTGPVTMLNWSFVRSDQPRELTCRQLALAIADEARDLERAGAAIIQVDEAALREGMPLRAAERSDYLRWAIDCFRLTVAALREETQVHSHMCYSDFGHFVTQIARIDADVLSIEASRGDMELLAAFAAAGYANAIGPGVWDVHAPRVPGVAEIEALLTKAGQFVARERLWVNPDCGLKTRGWEETAPALRNMVAAAQHLRTRATVAAAR